MKEKTSVERQEELEAVKINAVFKMAEHVKVTNGEVSFSNTSAIEYYIFTPTLSTPTSTFFYIPGTASTTISPKAEKVICSHFVTQNNWRVILIVHRLTQQNKYPIPLNDINHCINHFIDQHRVYSIDLDSLVIGGFSAGGCLALSVCLIANQRKYNPFSQIVLIAPVVSLADKDRNYRMDAPFLDPAFFRHMINSATPESIGSSLPALSPLNNLLEAFVEFPPITVVYGSSECLAEELEQFIEQIKSVVPINSFKLTGRKHDFPWKEVDYIKDISPAIKAQQKPKIMPTLLHSKLMVYPYPEIIVFGKPPPFSDSKLIVRKFLNQTLREYLLQNFHHSSAKCVRLFGEGGFGKTELGLFYFQHSYAFYNFRLWFTASDVESLKYQYKELGIKLKLFDPSLELAKCVGEVTRWLQRQSGYLVVYDDVNPEQLPELQKFLPNANEHAIIISRSDKPLIKGEYFVEVSAMEPGEAVCLFNKRLVTPEQEDILILAQRLSYIPLSMALAAEFITDKQLSIRNFIALFDSKITISSSDPVNIVIDIVVSDIISLSQQCSLVLYCCCLLSPYQIPINILNKLVNQNFLKSEAKKVLSENFSILSYENNDDVMLFNIHPWIQETIKKKLLSDDNLHLQTLNLLLGVFVSLDESLLKDHYYPHLDSVLRHVKNIHLNMPYLVSGIVKSDLALAYCKISFLYNVYKSISDAIENAKAAEKYIDACDDKVKIFIIKTVVNSHWPFGNVEYALKRAIELKQLCNDKHFYLDCAKACHILGNNYHQLGQLQESYQSYAEAQNYYELALKDTKTSAAIIHLCSAKTLVMQSYVCGNLGDCGVAHKNDEGLKLVIQANSIWERVNKESAQPDEATVNMLTDVRQHILNCLGVAHLRKKEYAEGDRYVKEAILLATQLYGESGRMTAQSKIALSITFDTLQKAVENLLDALTIQFKLFPKDHIGIADSYRCVAEVLVRHNRTDIAFYFYKHCYFIMRNDISAELIDKHYKIFILRKIFEKYQWDLAALDKIYTANLSVKDKTNCPTTQQVRQELVMLLNSLLIQNDNTPVIRDSEIQSAHPVQPVALSNQTSRNSTSPKSYFFSNQKLLFFSGLAVGIAATVVAQNVMGRYKAL